MNVQIKKFGKLLISRPAGKEAFAVALAYIFPKDMKEITLDFEGVDVLAPSWADEFITGIKSNYKDIKINFINTENESVKVTLDLLSSIN